MQVDSSDVCYCKFVDGDWCTMCFSSWAAQVDQEVWSHVVAIAVQFCVLVGHLGDI